MRDSYYYYIVTFLCINLNTSVSFFFTKTKSYKRSAVGLDVVPLISHGSKTKKPKNKENNCCMI